MRGEDLVSFTNLVSSLQGKVPGLQVLAMFYGGQTHYVIRMRGGRASIFLPSEPLVVVDGTIMGGTDRLVIKDDKGRVTTVTEGDTAGDRLEMINPTNVARIEVTTRANSLYGAQGANGVITVFTKSGGFGAIPGERLDPKSFDIFNIEGYSKPNDFTSPDYSKPEIDSTQADYRSTLYWNPEIRTDHYTGTAQVSFYAGDVKGIYRVVVEGITEKGIPVRAEFSFEIK